MSYCVSSEWSLLSRRPSHTPPVSICPTSFSWSTIASPAVLPSTPPYLPQLPTSFAPFSTSTLTSPTHWDHIAPLSGRSPVNPVTLSLLYTHTHHCGPLLSLPSHQTQLPSHFLINPVIKLKVQLFAPEQRTLCSALSVHPSSVNLATNPSFLPLSRGKILTFQIKHIMINRLNSVRECVRMCTRKCLTHSHKHHKHTVRTQNCKKKKPNKPHTLSNSWERLF